jgi:hypothetical protein
MKVLVGAFAALLMVGFPAHANTAASRDGDDVRGPLDIKRIVHGHGNGGVLWHKVVMRKGWGADDLRGDDDIRFYFSNDREDRFDEVHASVARKNGKLAAWVFPYVEGGDFASVGPSKRIRYSRPNRRTIKIFFDESWLDRRGRYAWSVGSSYRDKDSSSCRETCFDYAPGHNPERLVHDL